MHAPGPSSKPASEAVTARAVRQYTGEVVYVFAFDVAYETKRMPVRELLGQPVAQFSVDANKRSPRQLFFYRPQMVRLPPVERIGPHGPVQVQQVIKLLPVGALSITVRVPFRVDHIEDLVAYHDLSFNNGSLHDEVLRLADEARRELKPHFIRPKAQLDDEEAYTVFCLESPLVTVDGGQVSAEQWHQMYRRQIAALLTQEPEVDLLSDQEAVENTGRYLSYYENDLVVIDWDAALVLDDRRNFDETLYIMELANLQLTELEAYDRILDDALERAYRDVGAEPLRGRRHVLRELREIRVDFARLSDELSNITKFFGDWHLARIYENTAARFHLADWHRAIDGKLQTLGDLYQLLQQDQNNRLMVILELTIVLLFIIDLIILVLGFRMS